MQKVSHINLSRQQKQQEMKFRILSLILGFSLLTQAQSYQPNPEKIKEDFDYLIQTLSNYYAYKQEKKVTLKCIKERYSPKISQIKTEEESVLFFEYILDEFYDSHLILNTNRSSSYRLFSPVYTQFQNGRFEVTSVWKTQISPINRPIIDAEIISINNQKFTEAIQNFPTQCQDKKDPKVREWIANKILAGRYNLPRKVKLKLKNGQPLIINLDQLKIRRENNLLNSATKKDIGIIRINNSLGKDELVNEFDKALNTLRSTKGLILDLRNTVDGGDSYEARGIMGRFIKTYKPYQRHSKIERSTNNPDIERSWIEYVTPRLQSYDKPLAILVGRWTGSMGEGLAIGLEGMKRGIVIGTEMERLAGEIYYFSFNHRNFGFRIPAVKLFHLNGTPREKYKPTLYVKQTSAQTDEAMQKAMVYLKKQMD